MQKYYYFPILSTLDMSGNFHQKQWCQIVIPIFLRYYKDIAHLLLWVLWECLIIIINNDSITFKKTLILKVLKSTCIHLYTKYQLHLELLFWDIVKILQTCYFEYFENDWSCQSIMIVSLYRKFWSPKCWNQLAGNFDVYLYTKHHFPLYLLFEILWRHCKLALLELWECLTMPIKNHNINLWETFTLICMQKINFITQDIAKEIANLLFWAICAFLTIYI